MWPRRRRRLIDALAAAYRLPSTERLGFVRAFVGLAVVDAQLRLWGFERAAAVAAPGSAAAPTLSERQRQQIGAYVRWIDAASRHHPLPAHCLHRSVLLLRWLRRDGLPAELRIGVRHEDGALQAHAWIELGGLLVNDDPEHVSAFVRLAGAAAPSSRQFRTAAARGGASA